MDEYNPNYSIYNTRSKSRKPRKERNERKSQSSTSPLRLSASFGVEEEQDLDGDTADFDELEMEGSIPYEPQKSLVRNSQFSATKNKTKASTRTFQSPEKDRFTATEGYRMTEIKPNQTRKVQTSAKKRTIAKNVRETISRGSYSPSKTEESKYGPKLTRGERTSLRKSNLKHLALKLKKYGELELHEVKIKNLLCTQKNYNAGFAFELLNPQNGIVNVSRLHNALRTNVKIDLVEKDVVSDIIERLAYINEQELLLSDMIFFEPTKNDPSYYEYRKNLSTEQDDSDTSWHRLYSELWKALINTVKQRRIIQKQM